MQRGASAVSQPSVQASGGARSRVRRSQHQSQSTKTQPQKIRPRAPSRSTPSWKRGQGNQIPANLRPQRGIGTRGSRCPALSRTRRVPQPPSSCSWGIASCAQRTFWLRYGIPKAFSVEQARHKQADSAGIQFCNRLAGDFPEATPPQTTPDQTAPKTPSNHGPNSAWSRRRLCPLRPGSLSHAVQHSPGSAPSKCIRSCRSIAKCLRRLANT